MKLVCGLGNPGLNYARTRHNAGFMALDYFADKEGLVFSEEKKFKCLLAQANINGEKTIFIKPLTYMNLSGDSLILVMNYYKITTDDILVISDDLDSEVGRVRLREDGSSGGHNGLKSIMANINTTKFKRIKIGIGRDKFIPVVDYVLGNFNEAEMLKINEALKVSSEAILDFINNKSFKQIASKYSQK